jgi:hypothetical protein
MSKDREKVFAKIISSMEEGKKKGEVTLAAHLRQKYNAPRSGSLARFLARSVKPEDVFVEIVNFAAPFAATLRDIYAFLDRHRSTVIGKADQFSFRFEDINDRVPFDLDSFPKNYVEKLSTRSVAALQFNPYARGRLLVDGPDCWMEAYALQNAGRHIVAGLLTSLLRDAMRYRAAEELVEQHRTEVEAVVQKAGGVIAACQRSLVPQVSANDELDFVSYGSDKVHWYYVSEEELNNWNRLVADYRAKRIDYSRMSDEQNRFDRAPLRFNLTWIVQLLAAWDDYHKHAPGSAKDEDYPYPPKSDDLRRYMGAFGNAYDLLFPSVERLVELLERIVESVILPYWRHRWRLYEVWALVYVLGSAPSRYSTAPLLQSRTDGSGAFDWVIPHGDARSPVGTIAGRNASLLVWFQRKPASLVRGTWSQT